MNVGDIMSQEVISIRPDNTVAEAAELMIKERISGLPVINALHVLVGIVTEGDLLRLFETGTEKVRPRWVEFLVSPNALADEYVQSHGREIADVMSRDVVVATENMPLDKAVSLMEKSGIKRLPVLRDGRVVGILSRANLLRALAAHPPKAPMKGGDKVIREVIEKELENRAWKGRFTQVFVTDGVVDVWGYVTSNHHRDAILVAAKNVPGVKAVQDHLMLIEPFSGLVVGAGKNARENLLH